MIVGASEKMRGELMHRLPRKKAGLLSGSEQGFTLVELLMVMIVSLVIMAGMVGLIEMAYNQFNRAGALEAVTDASRRALSSIGRQLKSALRFDDANCDSTHLAFWADIDSNNDDADVDLYTNAEYVRFYQSGTSITQQTTEPASEGGATATIALCQDVQSVSFSYFAKGVKPIYSAPSYTNETTSNYNSAVGMIKARITFKKGKVSRSFEQDTFLRILNRAQ